MKKIQTFIYVLLMGFAFAACQDDSLGGTEQGGIRIALTDGTAGVDVTTRSTPSELFDGFKQKFKFQIKGGDNYDQTHDWTEDVIPLAAGVYDITATCGTEQADGVVKFDAPCYTGTKEGLKVNAGETATTAEISCKVTNALVSIQFDDEYKEYITDATYAMIAVESGTETNWADLSTSAYFKAGSSLTKLKIFKDGTDSQGADILTDAQKDANFPKTFAAGDHLILTLSIAKANGNVAIKVSKVEVKKVTIEETIPLEWLPKPKMMAEGFDGNTLTFAETETKEAKLNLKLASALQDIKFKFNFEDEQFSSLTKDKEYLLSTDKATIEEALGITLPAIGATNASIDFSGLVAKLQSKVNGATTNKIMIVPKANDRWSSEKTDVDSVYTFTCNKPEFSIAVQEGNVWTKTFTIDEPTVTAGNAEVLKEKLVYQYKEKDADDNAWQTCSGGLEQVFSKAPANKDYQVRAFYREGIVSDVVDITLETPAQLPNSDMEEWWIETKTAGSLITKKTYYTFHPYAEGLGSSSWWDTNNDKAQGGTVALGIWYEGCFASCVSYTTDVHGGSKAALIYLSGCGDGYANTSGSYVGGAMVGSLFIGSYNSGIIQGHSFESRPSSLSFWYKYKPYNSDAFKVIVSLKDGDTEIATGTYEPTAYSEEDNAYKQATVDFNYTDDKAKATTICVQFLASNKTELSGSDFAWGTTINYPTIGDWTVHMGSVLKVDDIQLIYEK